MADAADGEDEFEAVDQRLSESQKFEASTQGNDKFHLLQNNVALQLGVHLVVLSLGQH